MDAIWKHFSDVVHRYLGISPDTLRSILLSLAVVAGYFVVRSILVRLARRRVKDVARKYMATKSITYLLGIVAVLALVRVWVGSAAGLMTYLGLVSAGLAIALRDPVTNLAGWLYIVFARPFTAGDRIEIHSHAGDVIDISLFQFSINEIGNWVDADQSTGRIIHVPNNWIFQYSCSNYNKGFNFIWNEIPVTVTFESDWRKAKDILTGVAQEHTAFKSERAAEQIRRVAGKYMIFYEKLTPIVWTSVIDYGVTLTVRYLCDPRRRRSTEAQMWEAILEEFSKCENVDFAYPTRRFYDNLAEGKPGTKPTENET